jgi:uncharacterized protein YodC (DUF2158 family)
MFEVNSLVVLKTGGPEMTVLGCGDITGAPHVWCRWLDANGMEKLQVFAEAAVKPAKYK